MEDEDITFASLLGELQVPEPLREAILATGIQTTADFAYAYNSTADPSDFVAKQSQALWDALGVTDREHCTPVARLRRALDKCKSLTQALDKSSSSPSTGSATQGTALNAWAEHAPPRLDSDAVQRMVNAVKSRYPGELLDKDSKPSIRLLSIVHQFFQPGAAKTALKWVPWQLRMSQHQYQEIMEARSSRTLRTEAQLISNALFDETPQLNINTSALSPAWLSRTQQVFNGAHLYNLKALDKKVFDLCTQQLHPETGLRTVNIIKLLQADRKSGQRSSQCIQMDGRWTRHCMN